MKSPDNPTTLDSHRRSHGPTARRLSSDELDDLVNRLTGDSDVEVREAADPFETVDEEDDASSDELEELLE